MEASMIASGGSVDSEFLKALKQMPALKPRDIADAVLYVLSAPAHVQVHELMIKPVGEAF